MFSEDNFTY
jgi:hypothetical protein